MKYSLRQASLIVVVTATALGVAFIALKNRPDEFVDDTIISYSDFTIAYRNLGTGWMNSVGAYYWTICPKDESDSFYLQFKDRKLGDIFFKGQTRVLCVQRLDRDGQTTTFNFDMWGNNGLRQSHLLTCKVLVQNNLVVPITLFYDDGTIKDNGGGESIEIVRRVIP